MISEDVRKKNKGITFKATAESERELREEMVLLPRKFKCFFNKWSELMCFKCRKYRQIKADCHFSTKTNTREKVRYRA